MEIKISGDITIKTLEQIRESFNNIYNTDFDMIVNNDSIVLRDN